MKTSIDWLSRYVDIKWEPRELASRLTAAGLEVEGIDSMGAIPDGVVTAKILSREPHPNSDHMSICQVTAGGETLQIVCGAPNCDAGKIVPLAQLGTVFPDGTHIKKAKLRGVESNGMLCSARELGISEDHSGLMILPDDTPLGVPLTTIVKTDTVIDWEVTPNRPDWLSHIGIAREIAAVSGTEMRLPEMPIKIDESKRIEDSVDVTVLDTDLCPRYIARVFDNVKIGPSPEWMVRHLQAVGLRSINNVVDITNYVMLEFGNPLHAFDLKTLKDGRIIVRRAADGEKITTLDGTDLTLSHDNLLIADPDHGVALAGIMGGENSMITDDTTTVLIEAATFDRSNIRVSSRTLGKATDSSYRYERGVSPYLTELASQRAASLLCQLCGATQRSGVIDRYGKKWECAEIRMEFDRCNSRLGLTLTNDEIVSCLKRRGLAIISQDEKAVVARSPEWRFDLKEEHDIFEEVAQMCGLDSIPEAPVRGTISGTLKDDKFIPQETIRSELLSLGLDEIINYSLWSLSQCLAGTDLKEEDIIKVFNPISIDTAYLRPTILPGLLEVVNHNVARNEHDLRLFEMGRVFQTIDGKYTERTQTGVALTGRPYPERFSADLARTYDFYDMKGLMEDWLEKRGVKEVKWQAYVSPAFKKGAAAAWVINGKPVVAFGEAAPALTKGFRLRYPLFIAIIESDKVMAMTSKLAKYSPIPQFPATSRDVSFVAPSNLTHSDIVAAIKKLQLNFLEKIQLFDIFEDEKILGKGRRSLAYNITFRNPEKTITDDEANALQERIRKALAAIPGIELR